MVPARYVNAAASFMNACNSVYHAMTTRVRCYVLNRPKDFVTGHYLAFFVCSIISCLHVLMHEVWPNVYMYHAMNLRWLESDLTAQTRPQRLAVPLVLIILCGMCT